MNNEIRDLSINAELYALIPKPTKEEYDALRNSVKNEGQLESIIVWTDPVSGKTYIIDGHTRFKICKEIGIEPRIEYRKFESWLHAMKFAADVNLLRRHLSMPQRVELAIRLIEIEGKLADRRKKLTMPKKGHKGFESVLMPNGNNIGRTIDNVSKKTGIPSRTVARIKFVMDNGTEQTKNNLLNGKTKPATAERQIRKEKSVRNPIPLPKGKYRIILCDAPFKYDFEAAGAPDYPTLTKDEIINLKDKEGRPITDVFSTDAIMFFWSTMPKLEESFDILKEWKFSSRSGIVWSKEKDCVSQQGPGHYVISTCEILLIAIRGKPGTPIPENRPLGIIRAPRTRHSQKPDCVRRIIRKMYPGEEKRLELFARESVEGWVPWGDQLDLGNKKDSTKDKSLDDF